MPRRKARIEIGHRAFEELERLYDVKKYGNKLLVSKMVGCDKKAIGGWENGVAPDAIHLQRLHEIGADVMYILTGVRKNDG
jgi:phosphoribosylformimino-5-aminoimidazole carboxamide ribonucleotide (ProFAR) isomerase